MIIKRDIGLLDMQIICKEASDEGCCEMGIWVNKDETFFFTYFFLFPVMKEVIL